MTTGLSVKTHTEKNAAAPDIRNVEASAMRLLRLLGAEGSFATDVGLMDGNELQVFSSRKGVSLRVASAKLAAVEYLVRSDLAQWEEQGASGRRYLKISDVGRHRLARDNASPGKDKFQAQHLDLENAVAIRDGQSVEVTVDAGESPLAWLARRKGANGEPLLTPSQLEAGERFWRDLEQAQIMPRVTASWSATVASSGRGATGYHITDLMVAARQRIDKAIQAVGADCADLLIDVCGFLKSLKTVEFERGWPQRSAKVVLAIALSGLAQHYGLGEIARGRASVKMRHWGAAGYRPDIGSGEVASDVREATAHPD